MNIECQINQYAQLAIQFVDEGRVLFCNGKKLKDFFEVKQSELLKHKFMPEVLIEVMQAIKQYNSQNNYTIFINEDK